MNYGGLKIGFDEYENLDYKTIDRLVEKMMEQKKIEAAKLSGSRGK